MITALVGKSYRCTRVEVLFVFQSFRDSFAMTRALTAWHDVGWDGPAERIFPVSELHDVMKEVHYPLRDGGAVPR